MADGIDVNITDNSDEVLKTWEARKPVILEALGLKGEEIAKRIINSIPLPTKIGRIDTGRYINSVTHAVSGKGATTHTYRDNQGKGFSEQIPAVPEQEQAVYIGTNVEYALYLEQLDHTIKDTAANHTADYKKIIEEGMKDKSSP